MFDIVFMLSAMLQSHTQTSIDYYEEQMEDTGKRRTEWSSAHAQLWTSFKSQRSQAANTPEKLQVERVAQKVDNDLQDIAILQARIDELENELKKRDVTESETLRQVTAAIEESMEDTHGDDIMYDDKRRHGAKAFLAAIASSKRNGSEQIGEFLNALAKLEATVQLVQGNTKRSSSPTKEAMHADRLSLDQCVKGLTSLIGGSAFSKYIFSHNVRHADAVLEVQRAVENWPETALSSRVDPHSLLGRLSTSPTKISTSQHVGDDGMFALRRVLDLLGGDSSTPSNLASNVAELAVIRNRELEECRREIGTLNVVLAEFERTAQHQLSAIGVGIVPTIKNVRAQLAGVGVDDTSVKPSKGGEEGVEWLQKRVAHLIRVTNDAKASQQDVGAMQQFSLQSSKAQTLETEAKQFRRSVDDVISATEQTLKAMVETNTDLKEMLNKVLRVGEKVFGIESVRDGNTRTVAFAGGEVLSLAQRVDQFTKLGSSVIQTLAESCGSVVKKFRVSDKDAAESTSLFEIVQTIDVLLGRVASCAQVSGMTSDDLNQLGEVFNSLSVEIDSRWSSICELLMVDGDTTADCTTPVDRLFKRVSTIILSLPDLKNCVEESKVQAQSEVSSAIARLSQLLVPTHGNSEVTVSPSISSLDDLVVALQDRFSFLQASQSRQLQRVSHSRFDHTRLDELVREKCQVWNHAMRKALSSAAVPVSEDDSQPNEDAPMIDSECTVDALLAQTDALLQSIKSRLNKLSIAQRSDRIRLENYHSTHEGWTKRWQAVSADVAALALCLGIKDFSVKNDEIRAAVRHCIEFVSQNKVFSEASQLASEVATLRSLVKESEIEQQQTSDAFDTIADRLGDSAKALKRVLFIIGCDESPIDNTMEESIKSGRDGLAVVLGKIGRWTSKLELNVTELYHDQKRLVKYHAEIFKNLCSGTFEVHDANLLDMNATLIRFADGILPAVDSLLDNGRAGGHFAPSDGATASGLFGYDHRLDRIHETTKRINSTIEALFRVKFLSIPTNTIVASNDDDAASPIREAVGFLDIDAQEKQMNTEDLIRVMDKNASHLLQRINAFSNSYKHANILLQKDMDEMQQELAEMLSVLGEMETDKAFGIDREQLFTIYTVMNERATRQKGCYFFNRPSGEGVAPWNLAIMHLNTAFSPIVNKLAEYSNHRAQAYSTLDAVADELNRYRTTVLTNASVPEVNPLVRTVPSSIKGEGDDGDALPSNSEAVQMQHTDGDEMSHDDLIKLAAKAVDAAIRESVSKHRPSSYSGEDIDRLQEQIQVLSETVAVGERKLVTAASAHVEEIQRLENERDKALSEAAVCRAQLRKRASASNATVEPHLGIAVHGAAKENMTPPPSPQKHAPASSSVSKPYASSSAQHVLSLSSVEAYMRNLQHELHSRHLCDSPVRETSRAEGPVRRTSKQNQPQQKSGKANIQTQQRTAAPTLPHTMLSSPNRSRSAQRTTTDHALDDHTGCDTCERQRCRSTSAPRNSRSETRPLLFQIPPTAQDVPDSKNRHAGLEHYISGATNGSTFKVPPRIVTTPQKQHHVVVVSSERPASSSTVKASTDMNKRMGLRRTPETTPHSAQKDDREFKQAITTLLQRAHRPEETPPLDSLVNLESEGMHRLVNAFRQKSSNN